MHNGSQGLNKRNKHRMRKTCRYGSHGEMRQNAYMRGKSHSNINANGKTNRETNQKKTRAMLTNSHAWRQGRGGRELQRCNAGHRTLWETAHDASANAWKVMERNSMSCMSPQFVYQLQFDFYCYSQLALNLSLLPLNIFRPPETIQLSNLCLSTSHQPRNYFHSTL